MNFSPNICKYHHSKKRYEKLQPASIFLSDMEKMVLLDSKGDQISLT